MRTVRLLVRRANPARKANGRQRNPPQITFDAWLATHCCKWSCVPMAKPRALDRSTMGATRCHSGVTVHDPGRVFHATLPSSDSD